MADAAAGPERARLVEYIRTRAAALDPPRLRARVRSAAAELEATLAGLTEQEARTAGRAGEWTVAQVVDHVAQSTVRAAEEVRHLRAGRRPPGPPSTRRSSRGQPIACRGRTWSGACGRPPARWTPRWPGRTVRAPVIRARSAPAVLVVSAPEAGAAPDIFTAELTWPEYALVQRLHFLDHRTQIRALRAALAASA